MDASTWTKIARQLPLSRSEQEVLRRFEEDPSGRQFLPLSDVFRNHKLAEESLEILTQGVQDHPGFAVARVVLARELFQRGLIVEAWTALDNAPSPLTDNVLAQKLRFKMAILLGDEQSARGAIRHLKVQQGIDPEIMKISERLESEGIQQTRASYIEDLENRGVSVRLPGGGFARAGTEAGSASGGSGAVNGVSGEKPRGRGRKFVLEYEIDDATRRHVERFHVVPLAEVFLPEEASEDGQSAIKKGRVELDSTTLAEIYAKQGFYSKALAIYRRLLKIAPHNDLIRLKAAEMARLDKEEKNEDFDSDVVVYDRMEVVEIIDRQSRFLTGLLEKLERR